MAEKSREKLLRVNRERVAIVTTSYPERPGDPAGHFVEAEVHALEAAGAEVHVFALRGVAFGWPGVASRVREKPWLTVSAAREAMHVSRELRRNEPFSRVIAHWAIPSAWPIARYISNVEVVSHGGDVRLLIALPALARNRLFARIMQNASIWRFASEPLRDELLVALASEQRRRLERIAKVVAPAITIDVDARGIATARSRQRALAGSMPAYVTAARLVPSKRIDRAIAIAARDHATLLVIGEGPERENLERQTRERHANAYFLGHLTRPETLAHIAAADALVHTSQAEGLSSVVREAEHFGTRIIRA